MRWGLYRIKLEYAMQIILKGFLGKIYIHTQNLTDMCRTSGFKVKFVRQDVMSIHNLRHLIRIFHDKH